MSLLSQWTDIKKNLKYSKEMSGHILENDLPYTPLAYIQSDGNQRLNTGFVPNQQYKIEMDFMITTTVAYESLWGDRGNGSPTRGNVWGSYGSSNFFVIKHSATYSKGQTVEVTINNNIRYKLKVDYATKTVYRDGVSQGAFTDNLGSSSRQMWILNANGTDVVSMKGRLYGFKIWNGSNTLIQDLVPALDSDGVACMWDNVSQTFFRNTGSGSFVAGQL